MPKSTKCTIFLLCQGPRLPQGRAGCPGEGRALHQELLAHYNPSEKGAQLCKAFLKMPFVKADTHLSLPVVLSTEIKPCLHPRLTNLNFQSRPIRVFSFWSIMLVEAPELFGDSKILKLVLSNLEMHLWLFYV